MKTASNSAEAFFFRQAQEWDERYLSRTYRERRQLVRETVSREVARLNRPAGEIDLLDFGCGGGVLLKDFAELGLRVTGVDNSDAMLRQARIHLGDDAARVRLELLQDASGTGAYEAEDYDIVVCVAVLEFIPEPAHLLKKLAERVRAGGMLLLLVPNRNSILRKVEGFAFRHPGLLRMFRSASSMNDSYLAHERHQFAQRELTQLLQCCSLRPEAHRFHVAPKLLTPLQNSATIGMMLTAVFRKDE